MLEDFISSLNKLRRSGSSSTKQTASFESEFMSFPGPELPRLTVVGGAFGSRINDAAPSPWEFISPMGKRSHASRRDLARGWHDLEGASRTEGEGMATSRTPATIAAHWTRCAARVPSSIRDSSSFPQPFFSFFYTQWGKMGYPASCGACHFSVETGFRTVSTTYRHQRRRAGSPRKSLVSQCDSQERGPSTRPSMA